MGRCAAIGCEGMGSYKFPSDPKRRKKWERALRRKNYESSDFSRLCGKHFKDTDFETTSKTTGFPLIRKFLKKSAVPSVFSWNTPSSTVTSARSQRIQQRNARRCLLPYSEETSDLCEASTSTVNSTSVECLTTNCFGPDFSDLGFIQEIEIPYATEDRSTDTIESLHSYNNAHQSTQTTTLLRIFSTDELLIDDESVHYYTGLETYENFKVVLSTLCPMANYIKYRSSQVINMSIEDQFLILLIKLRRNKCDFELSKYFGVSKSMISNIFVTWLNFTYDLWSLIDIWPEKELVNYYMPTQFKEDHPNTRIIIDGTEIPITKPKNPTAQQATFSSYKNKNTMKFLVGATPGGLYSYCSEGYGGSTSDRQMIERSNLLKKCDAGDSIMADRGFNVQDIFASKNIGINIPTFLKGKSQLSGVVVRKDRKLASQRVHIERLIGLSKTFTILKSDLNPYYVPLASRIFFICVMLCNFRQCIVNTNK